MQTSRWIYTNDSWDPYSSGEYYYVHADDNLLDGSGMKVLSIIFSLMVREDTMK